MALEIVHVTQKYGNHVALDDVTMRVRQGDCYGFIGHNGAGKTTAMRAALGLIRPQNGTIRVDGIDIRKRVKEARARMGGLIESSGFFMAQSGAANLTLLARVQGMSSSQSQKETRELLDLVGLTHVGLKPVRSYSQGMRQRLGIAQALMGRPDYIFLDEPGNGLDPEGLAEMRALLVRLTREKQSTIILSSHQLHEVEELCNRIAILKQGKLLIEADTEVLLRGSTSSYHLCTDDDAALDKTLTQMGLSFEKAQGKGLLVDIKDQVPGDVAKAVVDAGHGLLSFAPKSRTLEKIYLDLEAPITPQAPELATEPKGTNKAPAGGTWRAFRYETSRFYSRPATLFTLCLPGLIGIYDVYARHLKADAARAALEQDGLATTTEVTAFEGVAFGLPTSLWAAGLLLCGFASQSLASELAQGTLRNVLLRPLTRIQLALGKFLSLAATTLLTYAFLILSVLAAAAGFFDFVGVSELLPNGERFPLIPIEDLWPELRSALMSGLFPLLGYMALGFFAGAITRRSATALGLSLGLFLITDLGRTVARAYQVDQWLLSAHLPSPFGDTSFLGHYGDVVQGVSNALPSFSQYPILFWVLACFLISTLRLLRRSIP